VHVPKLNVTFDRKRKFLPSWISRIDTVFWHAIDDFVNFGGGNASKAGPACPSANPPKRTEKNTMTTVPPDMHTSLEAPSNEPTELTSR
jgi:hypothetical protein